MSDVVVTLRQTLAECPICFDQFNDTTRIPRRMPCCGQPICQECLTSHVRKRTKVPCPLCGITNNLPGGATSLPKDLTILRFLDVLKTQRDAVPMCTDCPDGSRAMAKCDECGIYLCDTCFKAHALIRTTRNHKTSTFEELQTRRSTRPQSSAGRGTSTVDPSELKTKLDRITQRMEKLSGIEENITKSQKFATEKINRRFDDMIGELQERRAVLLSQVEAKADRERKSVKRALESHKSLKNKLETASKSGNSLDSLLKEISEDVRADRVGVTFTEVNMQKLLSTIHSAGQVRVVTYTSIQRPNYVPEDKIYNTVRFSPEDCPQGADNDIKISTGNKDIICPHVEFDHNMSSDDVQISSRVVSNIRTDPAPQDTGCRLQSVRRALTQRPLLLRTGEVTVLCSRSQLTVKQLLEENKLLWETAVTSSLVDTTWNQQTGLSVQVGTCNNHKQHLCLWVLYDDELLTDVPLCKYQVGVSHDVHVGVVIDRDASKVHVVDINNVKVITTKTGVVFDRPLWVLMFVDIPSSTEMKSELISGRELTFTSQVKQFLTSLI